MSFQWLTKWMSEIVLLGSTLYFTYQLSFISYCCGEAGVVFTLSLRACHRGRTWTWRHRLNQELHCLPLVRESRNVFTTDVNITQWFPVWERGWCWRFYSLHERRRAKLRDVAAREEADLCDLHLPVRMSLPLIVVLWLRKYRCNHPDVWYDEGGPVVSVSSSGGFRLDLYNLCRTARCQTGSALC